MQYFASKSATNNPSGGIPAEIQKSIHCVSAKSCRFKTISRAFIATNDRRGLIHSTAEPRANWIRTFNSCYVSSKLNTN